MIDEALGVLADKLNAHLLFEFGLPADVVHLGPISANLPRQSKSKLILSLVHVSQEATKAPAREHSSVATSQMGGPAPINLHVLVAANFDDRYTDGLAQLSAAISYFQDRPVFTKQTTPTLPTKIERMSIEWQDIDIETQSSLWSNLDHSYLPSALFRVRVVTVQDVAMFGEHAINPISLDDSE